MKPGSYVLRSRVRSGKLTDARDSSFTVVARAAEAKRTEEPKSAGKGPAVDRDLMRVQGQLKELGHDPGSIDGRMSPQTQAALRAFQKDYGLEMTGQSTRRRAPRSASVSRRCREHALPALRDRLSGRQAAL
jgi:peptidoglycan hydrolase-like protein with peptidoglycan-binding domain